MSIGTARPCPAFSKGFDCLEPVTYAVARRAAAQGFAWVGRYVENLTPDEQRWIHQAGLGIAPLTEAITGEPLSARLGEQIGAAMAQKLASLGCPPGVHLWADHESPHPGSDSVGYLNARAAASVAAGFQAGQYGGIPFDLSAAQLYELGANRYWRGGGAVPEPACGFCVLQLPPLDQVLFEGQRVDIDMVCEDFRGRLPVMWWP